MNKEWMIKEVFKSDILLIHLSGDITKTSGEMLLQSRDWESGLDQAAALILDFTGVEYINSAGIASLIRLVRMGSGGLYRTGCYGVNHHYEKLFRMVGLTHYMTIYPSQWSAFESIKGNANE